MKDKPFEVGSVVTGAEITDIDNLSVNQLYTVYDVIYRCCDKPGKVTHNRFKQRLQDRAQYCEKCSRKHGGKKSPIKRVSPHDDGWYSPPSALENQR